MPSMPVENEHPHNHLYAMVLAAGASSRFGGSKQLAELDGQSLLHRAVKVARQLMGDRVKVILGLNADKLEREIEDLEVKTVCNPDWKEGISSSLKKGIEALPQDCDAVLITFCDQPFVMEENLNKLIDKWNQDQSRIIACSYADTVGVPVIFPRNYFPKLCRLTGDTGAKVIIKQEINNVVLVELPEAEIDIDTQSDFERLLKNHRDKS